MVSFLVCVLLPKLLSYKLPVDMISKGYHTKLFKSVFKVNVEQI